MSEVKYTQVLANGEMVSDLNCLLGLYWWPSISVTV